ncbi:hypothetical protein K9L67_05070 [Candidatus Woesearchaeota archaeon]|nr:hypothetical protein [Candidatus Woesearchaeota archaeon]MCF7901569.1 hypothetical protein [Candidatus Woesearchaeota archaeon]MCF8013974.1 hypothetical protein [Candidatus Woesearchaeota archaeon]
MSFTQKIKNFDDLVENFDYVLINTSTKGFSLNLNEDQDLVAIPEKFHKRPKRNSRTRIFRDVEFSNFSVANNKKPQYGVSLDKVNINNLLDELSFLGDIDFQKSSKTIIVGEKYFSKIKRKSKKKIKILEKKLRNIGLSSNEQNQLNKLYGVRGMKYSKIKTISIDDKFGGLPSNMEVKLKLSRKVYDKEINSFVFYGAGSLNLLFENYSEVRELTSGKYGYEMGVKVILKYTGSNKEVGMPILFKVKNLLDDSYIGPLVDEFRNEKKEEEYFREINFIDGILNKDVEGDYKEGANGIKLRLPSNNPKFKGMRKRALMKERKRLNSQQYDLSNLVV